MSAKLKALCLVTVGMSSLFALSAQAARKDSDAHVDVEQLIAQLGDDQYLLRQRAETQLLARGAEVFSALQAASQDADLEISTRASYILNQISIDWAREYDPPVVRAIMSRYGDLSQKSKFAKILELAKLSDQQGVGALCRIARFDSTSGLVSRYAALAVLKMGLLPTARVEAATTMLNEELGEAEGAPSSWLQLYGTQLQSQEKMDPRWLELIDEEIELLAEGQGITNEALTRSLLRTHLNLSDRLADDASIVAGLLRRIGLGGESRLAIRKGIIDAIDWLVLRERWSALSLLEDEFASEIKADRRLLYHVALTRETRGMKEEAEKIAEKALAIEDGNLEERNSVASMVADRGHHDWAEREWQAVVEAAEVTDLQSILARQSLGLFCLNDRLQHKAAADLLTEAIDAIENDRPTADRYNTDKNLKSYLDQFRSNQHFFLAAYHASQGEFEKEREHLEQAFQLEPGNADIIIAMYHSKEADEAYTKKMRGRLDVARNQLEKEINEVKRMKRSSPELNRYLAHKHNHWAWLVSNTEGDFDKAVRYSKRSLELQPGSASYLDTLGRCYYAAGDLEKAVEVQREAVAQQPYLMVMQRQLKTFEDELTQLEATE